MNERVAGIVLLISGSVMGYLCVYQPLASAVSGASTVSVSFSGTLLAPLGLYGLIYVVWGESASEFMGTREKPTMLAYVVGIGLLLVGIGLYIWLSSTLHGYGYDV